MDLFVNLHTHPKGASAPSSAEFSFIDPLSTVLTTFTAPEVGILAGSPSSLPDSCDGDESAVSAPPATAAAAPDATAAAAPEATFAAAPEVTPKADSSVHAASVAHVGTLASASLPGSQSSWVNVSSGSQPWQAMSSRGSMVTRKTKTLALMFLKTQSCGFVCFSGVL